MSSAVCPAVADFEDEEGVGFVSHHVSSRSYLYTPVSKLLLLKLTHVSFLPASGLVVTNTDSGCGLPEFKPSSATHEPCDLGQVI